MPVRSALKEGAAAFGEEVEQRLQQSRALLCSRTGGVGGGRGLGVRPSRALASERVSGEGACEGMCVCVGWVDVGAACRVAGSAAAAAADGDSSLLIL